MALVPAAEVVHGLRLGTLVEVCGPVAGGEDVSGQLGQLEAFSEHDGLFDVRLISGASCRVQPGSLRSPATVPRPGLGGGPESFDVLAGPKSQESALGEEVATCLFEKGFCVLKTCYAARELEDAVQGMRRRGDTQRLQRLPEEVEEGYLGFGARGKVAWMDPASPDCPTEEALVRSDEFMSTLASLIQPHSADLLDGAVVTERTPALASLLLLDDEEQEFPAQDADDAILGCFLRTYRRGQIKVVHFLGPASADVVLERLDESEAADALPLKQETVNLSCGPNTMLIFRTGVFRYACQAEKEFVSVSSVFLEYADPFMLEESKREEALLLTGGAGPAGPGGKQVVVVNEATRLMANWDEVEGYRAGLQGACDSSIEIPIMRFDVNFYYNPDDATRVPGQTYLKHQAYVEGLELFDNKYFEINNNDARVMDPMQRHVLEVGAMCLFKLGITKKDSNRTPHHAGCSVGLDKDDWDKSYAEITGCLGGTNVQAIISNRFSFIFNLRGPNYVADTACSASLAATHLAKFALMDSEIEKLEFHVAIGIHQCFMPWGVEGYGAKMMSGQCRTFNDTASGYMRGDGCSGMTLKYGELLDERDAVWRASRVGQNGRSATMTAPNGIAQEEVIMRTIREARIKPPESCMWNCHGTGTALGDPIEVGGVRRVMNKEPRDTTLLMLTNKTHTGHLEGGAAMTTLIAAVMQCKMTVTASICHFRVLNPNMDLNGFNVCIASEVVTSGNTQNNVHISSFGFGGTNGHCIMWGTGQVDTLSSSDILLKRIRKMAPPEVRVNGDDPSYWEWDGPDEGSRAKPGDRYAIDINPSDPENVSIRWTKEEEGGDADDGEDDFYCITGPFNDWEGDRMEDSAVTGLRTIVLDGPPNGVLQFRFLLNGEESEVLYPEVDQCTSKTGAVLGPALVDSDVPGREKNVWYVICPEGSSVRVMLFVCRGRRSVMWMPED